MNVILLDGNRIKNITDFHKTFMAALNIDKRYGKNLDALYDVLTSSQNEIGIIAVNTDKLSETLGSRWQHFLRLINDVSAEKVNIHFTESPFGGH